MTRAQYNEFTPELRVSQWIDAQGRSLAPLMLADLGGGFKVIFCFQPWCLGCHSHSFRTLSAHNCRFTAVQTVFEGIEINSFDRLRETQLRYGLAIPIGHYPKLDQSSSLMQDYGAKGNPWFVVIDLLDRVLCSDFEFNTNQLMTTLSMDVNDDKVVSTD